MSHSTSTHRRIHRPAGDVRVHGLRTVVDRRAGDRRGAERRAAPRRAADRSMLRSPAQRWLAVAIFTSTSAAVAITGAVVANRGMTWFDGLEQATFNPPDAAFGPVWSALFTLNAIAGHLAWRATKRPGPTIAWAVALALNLLWTLVFFGAHRPGLGLVVLGALWIAILVFAALAKPHDPTATWLMLPYLSWVTFAGILNYAIAQAN